ncbi:hypothetical protein HN51_028432 [Arachis hypogaea]|uniref:uncharacterized protein n=1 Tax=Arachis hypogaea TaxID=3818 RepID=UPI0034E6DE34|nr:uncharacterized protein DS421_9g271210 [Arachis hypogaea]
MTAPSAILRSLPLRFAAVAPLPEESEFGSELTIVLGTLIDTSSGEIGLAQLLDATIATQKKAINSLAKIPSRDESDHGGVDLHLETNVEVLDACNYFVDKIDQIKNYVESLRMVARLVDSGSSNKHSATKRALELLDSFQSVEKNYNCSSCLLKKQKLCHETEFSEIMCGSQALALVCCMFLDLGLSFRSKSKSKRGLSSSTKHSLQGTSSLWLRLLMELANQGSSDEKMKKMGSGSCFLMNELHQTVIAARELKEHIKGNNSKKEKEIKFAVERLNKSSMKLENGIVIIEGRVKDLYKSLIDVRMALLGILSHVPSNF